MPLPASWPPRVATGVRSIRFYKTGAATGAFADNAWIFADAANNANPYTPLPPVVSGTIGAPTVVPPTPSGTGQNNSDPAPMIWAGNLRITAVGGDIEFSFDGTVIHGKVLSGMQAIYRNRYEAGIAVRGAGTFYVEAW